jgi:flagellar basal body P-ring formation protein FlgA
MKRAVLIAAAFAAAAPAAAQDVAALLASPKTGAATADDDIPMASVLPVSPKKVEVKAAQNLRTGTVLHSSDLVVEGENKAPLDLFVGMELKRSVYAGAVLKPTDVGAPTAIQRNAIVTLEFVRGPLMITTEGRSLDAGAVGETVRIMNLNSKTILTAVVAGPNKAVAQ